MWLSEAPVGNMILQMHTPVHTSQCWSTTIAGGWWSTVDGHDKLRRLSHMCCPWSRHIPDAPVQWAGRPRGPGHINCAIWLCVGQGGGGGGNRIPKGSVREGGRGLTFCIAREWDWVWHVYPSHGGPPRSRQDPSLPDPSVGSATLSTSATQSLFLQSPCSGVQWGAPCAVSALCEKSAIFHQR